MEKLLLPATHERVKFFKALQDHKARSQTGLYLLEGARLVRDAMLSAAPIALLMVRAGDEGKYRDVIEYAGFCGRRPGVGARLLYQDATRRLRCGADAKGSAPCVRPVYPGAGSCQGSGQYGYHLKDGPGIWRFLRSFKRGMLRSLCPQMRAQRHGRAF